MIESSKSSHGFCSVSGGIEVGVDLDSNRAIAVQPDSDNSISRGYTGRDGRARDAGLESRTQDY